MKLLSANPSFSLALVISLVAGGLPIAPRGDVSEQASAQSVGPVVPAESTAAERFALADAGVRSLMDLAEPCTATVDDTEPELLMPAAEAADRLALPVAQLAACCRICTVGIACGNTCISARFTCHVGVGCACNAGAASAPTPEYLRAPEVSVLSQSAYPRTRVGQSVELQLSVLRLHGPSWFDRDVELVVSNADLAGRGLRGWDANGVIAYNTGATFLSDTNRFRLVVQALSPGVHRLQVRLRHKAYGFFGPDGIYWDVAVDALTGVARLYDGWHAAWVSQSSYLVMSPGQVAEFWIRFQNTGTEAWVRGTWGRQVNLGLNGDDRRPYDLGMATNWLWQDRIATTVSQTVSPGDLAEFRFSVRAPLAPGRYTLNLRPVADGTTWLEDQGVFWVVEVR